jgi:hypothetical protein
MVSFERGEAGGDMPRAQFPRLVSTVLTAILVAGCASSKGEPGDANTGGSSGDSAESDDQTRPSLERGDLTGAGAELIGTWVSSDAIGTSTLTLSATTFSEHLTMQGFDSDRLLEGAIAGFSTEHTETADGITVDGFLIVQITNNEGLQIAEPGEYGRLSWRNQSTDTKEMYLGDAYFATEAEAVAEPLTSYDMWGTYARQSSH